MGLGQSALLALDPCLPEIFGAHVEESESRASAPELAGTVDSADRGDAESAEVGVQIVIHERAVAVDLRSEILAASLAAPANEPERAMTPWEIRQSIAPGWDSMLRPSGSSSHIHEDTTVDLFVSCMLWTLLLVMLLFVLATGVAHGIILRGGFRSDDGDDDGHQHSQAAGET